MKPYITKVAYYVVETFEAFNEISEFLEENAETFSYRELCNGEGSYLEVEKAALENKNIPVIGDVTDLDVNIIQIWL